ncbi:MAG: hypothetical protein M3464_05125 [Chloroflexota bacterium]|nr:hypothetical protein [Chloroflexota bacterium]
MRAQTLLPFTRIWQLQAGSSLQMLLVPWQASCSTVQVPCWGEGRQTLFRSWRRFFLQIPEQHSERELQRLFFARQAALAGWRPTNPVIPPSGAPSNHRIGCRRESLAATTDRATSSKRWPSIANSLSAGRDRPSIADWEPLSRCAGLGTMIRLAGESRIGRTTYFGGGRWWASLRRST